MPHKLAVVCCAFVSAVLVARLAWAATPPATTAYGTPTPTLPILKSVPAGVMISCQVTSTDPSGSVSLSMKPSTIPHTVQYQAQAATLSELTRRFDTPWKDTDFQRCGAFRGLWVSADGQHQRVEGKSAADVIARLKALGAP